MSKLRDAWEDNGNGPHGYPEWQIRVEAAITEAEAEIARLTRERDEARAKLLNLADATEVAGMSWDGFNIIGDPKSIRELQRLKNRADQLELYQREFRERVVALTSERDAALAKVEQMDAALKWFAEEAEGYDGHPDSTSAATVTVGDLRAARAARKEPT